MKKGRNLLLDNAKFFLVFLILITHAVYTSNDYSILIHTFRTWSSYWVMPTFCFISGFLAKSYVKLDRHGQMQKVFTYVSYYLFGQVLFIITDLILGSDVTYSIFAPRQTLWYLMCIIIWHVLLHYVAALPRRAVLIICFLVAMFSGFDGEIGSFLAFQRAINNFPIFLLGYYTSFDSIKKLRKPKLKLAAGFILIAAFVLAYFILKYKWFSINYTNTTFYLSGSNLSLATVARRFFFRFMFYLLAVILGGCFLAIVPSGRRVYSSIGTRTLQIYLYHGIPLRILRVCFNSYFHSLWGGIALAGIFIVLGLILSLNALGYPLKLLGKIKIPIKETTEIN